MSLYCMELAAIYHLIYPCFPGEQVVINQKLRSASKNETGVFVEEVNISKKVYWFTSFSLFHIA